MFKKSQPNFEHYVNCRGSGQKMVFLLKKSRISVTILVVFESRRFRKNLLNFVKHIFYRHGYYKLIIYGKFDLLMKILNLTALKYEDVIKKVA